MKIFSEFVFPKQIVVCYDDEYPTYKDCLVDFCHDKFDKDPEGAHFSNVRGWQSHPQFDDNFYNLEFVSNRLKYMIDRCVYEQLEITKKYKAKMDRWWINISKKGSYNTRHTHPFCHYSGIFYVKSDNSSATVNFRQNSIYDTLDNHFRSENIVQEYLMSEYLSYQPEEGKMLLFPSNLAHDVSINNHDTDRISISFDLLFVQN